MITTNTTKSDFVTLDLDQFTPEAANWLDISRLVMALFWEWIAYRVYRAKYGYRHMNARVRGITLIMLAVGLLMGAGYVAASTGMEYYRNHTGPFLAEALESPYDLNARPLPAVSEEEPASILPRKFGNYTFSTADVPEHSHSLLSKCLIGLPVYKEGSEGIYCDRSHGSVYVENARYVAPDKSLVDVVAVQFADEAAAADTLTEVMRFTRKAGQVGNFAVEGVTTTDYFYGNTFSSMSTWYSFVWRHGAWVYAISAQQPDGLDPAITAFPY